MLSKKRFVEIINDIKLVSHKLDELMKLNSHLALSIVEEYSLQDTLINTLEEVMNIQIDDCFGSAISWWIYETDFGKDSSVICIKEGNKEKEYHIKTAEQLYDYIIKHERKEK